MYLLYIKYCFMNMRNECFSILCVYGKIYPEIKPLMLLIKYALKQRDLNEIYKGGVNSFITFSLLYYYKKDC